MSYGGFLLVVICTAARTLVYDLPRSSKRDNSGALERQTQATETGQNTQTVTGRAKTGQRGALQNQPVPVNVISSKGDSRQVNFSTSAN